MSEYRKQLESWLKTLDVKADTVLDIGGKQLPVRGRTKSWDVKNYRVLDLPYFNLEEEVYYLDNGDKFNRWMEFDSKANVVFCLEVFEYLIDPLAALSNIFFCLKYKGKAYITFPFVYPHHNELKLDALRYTEPGIKRLAESAGLRVTNTWYRRDKSGLLQQFYAADGMRAAKEYLDHSVTGFICQMEKK